MLDLAVRGEKHHDGLMSRCPLDGNAGVKVASGPFHGQITLGDFARTLDRPGFDFRRLNDFPHRLTQSFGAFAEDLDNSPCRRRQALAHVWRRRILEERLEVPSWPSRTRLTLVQREEASPDHRGLRLGLDPTAKPCFDLRSARM